MIVDNNGSQTTEKVDQGVWKSGHGIVGFLVGRVQNGRSVC